MLNTWALAIIILSGTLASLELGYRIGLRDIERGGAVASRGVSTIEGAVFGLLGLLLAFSFSGAAARFEARRHLITTEVNAIGTAWLRLDLLPTDSAPRIRGLFREYAELRAVFFREPLDGGTVASRQTKLAGLQRQIWNGVLRSFQASPSASQAPILLIPALNAMFDIAESRFLATQNHPPPIISTLLVGMTFLAATLAGYGMVHTTTRSRFHRILFALVMTLTIAVIADLEYPRRGFIRVDVADEALQRLAQSFNAGQAPKLDGGVAD